MASKGRELGNIVSPQTGIAVTFSGDPVVLGVGNTEHVRVTGAGDIYLGGYLQSSSAHNTLQKIKVAPYNWTGGSTAEIASIEMGAENTGSDDGSIIFKTAHNVNSGGTLDEAMRIRYDGNIGIGTDNPDNLLHLQKNGGNAILELQNTGNGNHSGIFFVRESIGGPNKGAANIHVESDTSGSGSALVFGCGSNISSTGSEKARVTSGGDVQIANGNLVFSTSGTGIDFSATSNGTGANQSELLDDFEEGTWTPKFVDNANGNDYFVNNGLVIYHATYVKIGEYCWTSAYIANDASFSYATGIDGTQAIGIGGLPFTITGGTTGYYPISIGYFANLTGWGAGYTPMGYFRSGTNRIVLTYATANTVTNVLGSTFLNGGSGLLFSGYYKVS
jgi:hypothetical protein